MAQVVGFDDYDPWGMILPSRSMATGLTNIDAAKNRFTSKAWDDEFGLDWNYFGARCYDPEIGRWTSADPLAEKSPSLSPYNYVANNPSANVDPNGEYIVSANRRSDGSINVTATRTSFAKARFAGIASLHPLGAVAGLVGRAAGNDPSFTNQDSDYGFAAFSGVLKAGRAAIRAFAKGQNGFRVFQAERGLVGGALFSVDQFLISDPGALAIDQLTFDLANNLSIGQFKFGALGIGSAETTFTLNPQIAAGFSDPVGAAEFLQSRLDAISGLLRAIATAQGFDLSTEQGRSNLRNYIFENASEFQSQLSDIFP